MSALPKATKPIGLARGEVVSGQCRPHCVTSLQQDLGGCQQWWCKEGLGLHYRLPGAGEAPDQVPLEQQGGQRSSDGRESQTTERVCSTAVFCSGAVSCSARERVCCELWVPSELPPRAGQRGWGRWHRARWHQGAPFMPLEGERLHSAALSSRALCPTVPDVWLAEGSGRRQGPGEEGPRVDTLSGT